MRFLAAGARVLLVGAVVVAIALAVHAELSFRSVTGGGSEFQPPATYAYPSASFWPSTYPVGSVRPQPPAPTVSPCPSYAPKLVRHTDGSYECRANVPTPATIYNPCPAGEVVKAQEDGTEYCAPKS